jgi:hypothetical protein
MNEVMDDRSRGSRPDTGPTVTIEIDRRAFEIHRGRQSIAEIKNVGGVPLAYELDQFIDCKLVHLADDAAVTLKGGEQFFSHPRDNCAS